MAEYSEREAAVDALARLCKRVCQYSEKQRKYMCGACPLGDAFTVIEDDLPAADVRPVVKAYWIGEGDGYADGEMVYDVWHCSNCDYTVDEGDNEPPQYNFCPNCGADMREES